MVKDCAAQKCFLFITFFWIISIDKHCFKRILKYSNGSCVKLQFINTRKFDFLLLSSLIFKLPKTGKPVHTITINWLDFWVVRECQFKQSLYKYKTWKSDFDLFIYFFNLFQFLYSSKPECMSLRHV